MWLSHARVTTHTRHTLVVHTRITSNINIWKNSLIIMYVQYNHTQAYGMDGHGHHHRLYGYEAHCCVDTTIFPTDPSLQQQ